MSKPIRKLTTILAADCVGYSKLMDQNEELTLKNLKASRQIIDPTIEEYGGRIFHTAGDSVIAEFNSPVDCVNAAVEFQNILLQRNANIPENSEITFRVGIHLDDVIIEGENVYGGGVNIAARLEGICEPGCILLSRTVQDQISKRVKIATQSLGDTALKNIDGKFEIYQINPSRLGIPHHDSGQDIEAKAINRATKLRLLIVPFINLNKDSDHDYFVDGVVEDIITEFSLIHTIEIISRATAFQYKNQTVDVKKISKELDVNYIVTGSIRSSGERVRISVELTDPELESALWSERYDRNLEDVFAVQDEIVQKIMLSLTGEIEIKTLERSNRKPTANMTSYDFLLRGKVEHHKYQKDSHNKAVEFFNKAIEADPDNGPAYAWKACTVGGGLQRGFITPTPDIGLGTVQELISKAQEINSNDFECYRMLCRVYLGVENNHRKSEECGKKAFSINPNDPRILWGYGTTLALSGKAEEGLSHLIKAYELAPDAGIEGGTDVLVSGVILGYYASLNYSACIDWFDKLEGFDLRSSILNISCLHHLNRFPERDAELKRISEIEPQIDLEVQIELFRFLDEGTTDHLKAICGLVG